MGRLLFLTTRLIAERSAPSHHLHIRSHIHFTEELKLQSPLASFDRGASGLDYWNRAITTQVLPADLAAGRGLDITMSSYVFCVAFPSLPCSIQSNPIQYPLTFPPS